MNKYSDIPFWQYGFRPFFLGAASWAVISMLIWLGLSDFAWSLSLNNLPMMHWHAHEMIFGYSVAVVAGFLLTAVPNWTTSTPCNGILLILIFSSWLLARVFSLFGDQSWLFITAFADMIFMCSILAVVAIPILKIRQYRQVGILVKITLMIVANLVFYLGALGILEHGVYYGLYGGFYLIIAIILTMARRVMPMFIRNGLSLDKPLHQRLWIDRSSIVLFLGFFILELIQPNSKLSASFALALFFIHAVRLYDWSARGMLYKPLVWTLYTAYLFLVLGFAAKAGSLIGLMISPTIALHLFAIGSIGIITIGMMSRVALGHTGRNINNPPQWLIPIFLCLVIATILRVFLPLIAMDYYGLWISLSKMFWIVGFTGFVFLYTPILLSARINN